MKAIILCCDKYQICAYHTIKTYEKYLEGNNFVYILPYNEKVEEYTKKLRRDIKKRMIFVYTKKDFKITMNKLLKTVDNNEFVYWCSSDNYIEEVDKDKFMKIKELVEKDYFSKYDAISLCYNKKIHEVKDTLSHIEINSMNFLRCPPWNTPVFNIWNHQFMKGKILKAIWNSFDEPKVAKDLDKQLYRLHHKIYNNSTFINCKNLYVDLPIMKLGENTSRGKMTMNAFNNFKKLNLDTKLINLEVNKDISLIW